MLGPRLRLARTDAMGLPVAGGQVRGRGRPMNAPPRQTPGSVRPRRDGHPIGAHLRAQVRHRELALPN
jgi:hypothetical protein